MYPDEKLCRIQTYPVRKSHFILPKPSRKIQIQSFQRLPAASGLRDAEFFGVQPNRRTRDDLVESSPDIHVLKVKRVLAPH